MGYRKDCQGSNRIKVSTMKLITTYSLLGLQLLGYLANIPPQQQLNVRDIALYYQVSHYHLTKVVGYLNHLGYIQSRRGKRGGIQLNQSPETIQLGYLIQALEQGYPLIGSDHHHAARFYNSVSRILTIGLEALWIQLNEFTLIDLVVMND
jgi:Rrf2 family transcriptional regulator, nitric oxide-sensitive transcriptional repressor